MVLAMPEPVKRHYRSAVRDAQALDTRARIRQAASELFIAQGYAATTIRQVARRSGVGERTIYDAFSSKAALFGHVLDTAVGGDEADLTVAERADVLDAIGDPDPVSAVERYVDHGVDLLERAGDLIMVSIEAAGSDPDMRATADAGAEATHRLHLELTRALAERGGLRPGVDPESAADIIYGLISPHLHQLLRRHRGWSSDRYRTWLRRSVIDQILA